MKTSLITVILFLTSINLKAQYYTFDASTNSYEDLDQSTSLNNTMTWHNPHFNIPIGFDFTLYNKTIQKIILNSFGWGGSLTTNNKGIYTLLIAYGSDIVDRGYNMVADTITPESKSDISYQLDSLNHKKILKIHWKNAGFYHELADDSISSDYINFQLWLYEESNDIEWHFGPSRISKPNLCYNNYSGTYIALFPMFDHGINAVLGKGYVLTGDPTNPKLLWVDNQEPHHIDGTIPNGTIYRLSRQSIGLDNLNTSEIILSPNPVRESFSISSNNNTSAIKEIIVYNAQGQIVKKVNFLKNKIDVSELSNGIFYVKLITENKTFYKKMVKK
jgi:hypothetical protein